MTSETASTGKPVYRIDLAGGGKRLNAFHAGLERAKITKPFRGQLEDWKYLALNDAIVVDTAIRDKIGDF